MVPEKLQQSHEGVKTLKWDVYKENAGIWGNADLVKHGFVDHINTTKDTTDYLWHTTRFVSIQNQINAYHQLKCLLTIAIYFPAVAVNGKGLAEQFLPCNVEAYSIFLFYFDEEIL